MPSLLRCVTPRRVGDYYRVSGSDIASVLREVVELLRLPEEVDRLFLLRVLLAREAIASTAVGEGIAIPHVRNPVVLHVGRPTISLCFLENPVEYGALDGKPVHTLFTIISPTTRAHLRLMSQLSFVLRDPGVREAVAQQESRAEILLRIGRADAQRALVTSHPRLVRPVEAESSAIRTRLRGDVGCVG